MTNTLALALNQLNQDFYTKVVTSFSQTRQQPWSGWQWLADQDRSHLKETSAILDVGCGNGRFGEFLAPQLESEATYIGIDANSTLLSESARRLQPLFHSIDLRKSDFIKEIISHTSTQLHWGKSDDSSLADLALLFGVWHHLPTASSRLQMLLALKASISHDGHVWLSTWEFEANQSLMKRKVSPERAGITISKSDEWGSHDYILDWRRETSAYRYCHHSSKEEMIQLFFTAGLECLVSYQPEKGSDQDNRYYLLKPAV